jgi:hypothetical protein
VFVDIEHAPDPIIGEKLIALPLRTLASIVSEFLRFADQCQRDTVGGGDDDFDKQITAPTTKAVNVLRFRVLSLAKEAPQNKRYRWRLGRIT